MYEVRKNHMAYLIFLQQTNKNGEQKERSSIHKFDRQNVIDKWGVPRIESTVDSGITSTEGKPMNVNEIRSI